MLYTRPIKKEVFFILNNIKVGKKYSSYIENIFKKGELIKPKTHVSVVEEDHQDDKYLDCAISGKTKYIITNDNHLLKLTKYNSIRIIKPADFVKLKGKR